MPSILTSPPAIEPVTLAEAKAHLRVGHADDDAIIGTLIVSARRHLEAKTGLAMISQGWSTFRDDWPEGRVVELAIAPLIAVGGVKTYDEDNVATVVDPSAYFVDAVSRPARLLLRGTQAWARPGRIGNGIEIAFTAGFGAAAANVPEELRRAILQLAAHWYAERGDAREDELPLTVAAAIARFKEMRL
jgi:uncharacterized phiE125 gp8 family phage protein